MLRNSCRSLHSFAIICFCTIFHLVLLQNHFYLYDLPLRAPYKVILKQNYCSCSNKTFPNYLFMIKTFGTLYSVFSAQIAFSMFDNCFKLEKIHSIYLHLGWSRGPLDLHTPLSPPPISLPILVLKQYSTYWIPKPTL